MKTEKLLLILDEFRCQERQRHVSSWDFAEGLLLPKSKPIWPCFKIQKITFLFKMFLHYGINGLAIFLVREEN